MDRSHILSMLSVAKSFTVATVAIMSEDGDEAACAPIRVESANILARIGQRSRFTNENVARFDALRRSIEYF